MTPRPTLPEPIEVAKFFKTRWRNESVHITLSEYQENCVIDLRIWRTGADGIDRPTSKGLTLSVGKLKELSRALIKAEAMARELGLLRDGGAGE
jgi:hypothetical protein